MADVLSESEEKIVTEFIAIVKGLQLHKNSDKKSWNKATAVKFMMARKFDICRAVALFEAHEVMRRREGLIRIDPNNEALKTELETGKFTILPARDSNGAALAIFTANKHFPMESSHQITLQGVIYQLDVALESIETQRCGIVFIYNMTGSKYANFDYELSQKMLNLLKGGYPARLKKVLIVSAPLWFKASFKIFQLFLREKLRDRLFMLNIPQLRSHIPLTSLPTDLGGSFEPDHKEWLQNCLKSTLNRHENGEPDTTSPTEESPPDKDVAMILMDYQRTCNADSPASSYANSEEDLEEKQNVEEREKEVEVIKDAEPFDALPASEDDPSPQTPEESPTPTDSNEDEVFEDEDSNNSPPWENNEPALMGLEKFIEYLRTKGRKGLFEEYAELKATPPEGTFEAAKQKPNQPKNRYTDVLCYDHSRVKLPIINDDPNSDYINANFVDGYKQENAFISTQGPLPHTYADFWRMVWEQESHVIVMTTKCVERGRVKCGQYWPEQELTSHKYGDFDVYNAGVKFYVDYSVTNLVLTNVEHNTSQEVCHMQFTSWPDFGVPHSAVAMLDFRDRVRMYQKQAVQSIGEHWKGHALGPPIVVHCSAGIGRTGTFITLDKCINQLEDTGLIDIISTVRLIRNQRAFSIQMPDQYVFCHLALLEYALSRGLLEDVDLSGFNDDSEDSGSE